jgi:hypothetical protein
MLLCFQIRVNFTLVLCIACYHFEFGIAGNVCGCYALYRKKGIVRQFK